jgi:hypothetical protein
MKKSYILVLLLVMLTVTGCDFFRKVAGRPTTADIEAKKVEIARVEQEKAEALREQERLDSLRAVKERARIEEETALRDSLAAPVALKDRGCMMYDLSSMKGLASGGLDYRYYVIVGSFRDGANADRFIRKIAADSVMQPVKVHFRTGMIAVGVCPRNKIAEMPSVVDEVRTRSFCPKDAWILVNGQ